MFRLIGEVPVAEPALYFTRVLLVCRGPFPILRPATHIANTQLSCQLLYDSSGHVRGVAQKGPQKSHRAQLQGEAQTVVITAADGNQGPVGVVKIEIAG